MATHSNILAWRIPMARGAWQATVHGVTSTWGHEESDTTEPLSTHTAYVHTHSHSHTYMYVCIYICVCI